MDAPSGKRNVDDGDHDQNRDGKEANQNKSFVGLARCYASAQHQNAENGSN
jgi:hypothetical protein